VVLLLLLISSRKTRGRRGRPPRAKPWPPRWPGRCRGSLHRSSETTMASARWRRRGSRRLSAGSWSIPAGPLPTLLPSATARCRHRARPRRAPRGLDTPGAGDQRAARQKGGRAGGHGPAHRRDGGAAAGQGRRRQHHRDRQARALQHRLDVVGAHTQPSQPPCCHVAVAHIALEYKPPPPELR
jgi:hypothetical protein